MKDKDSYEIVEKGMFSLEDRRCRKNSNKMTFSCMKGSKKGKFPS